MESIREIVEEMLKPKHPEDLCMCGHPRKDHCKGGVWHTDWKDQKRQVPNPRGSYCGTAHCDCPLCCCCDFRLAEQLAVEFQEEAA